MYRMDRNKEPARQCCNTSGPVTGGINLTSYPDIAECLGDIVGRKKIGGSYMETSTFKTEGAMIVEVIRTVHCYGKGTEADPIRIEARYWTTTGKLMAKFDINDDPLSPLRPS
ncbi:MAG: hypothetical protein E7337_10920 [Clostridiales bacterium]|nr:hypothetical protein [Clostridiales bacterium]